MEQKQHHRISLGVHSKKTEAPSVNMVNSIHTTLDTLTGVVANIATRLEKMEHSDKHVSFSPSKYTDEPNQYTQNRTQNRAPRRQLICYRCGRMGHGWRKCYAKFGVDGKHLNE